MVNLAHRAGATDALGRRDLRGELLGRIGAPPKGLRQPARPPGIELTDRHQPLGDRRGLIAGGLTHPLDELGLRHAFEHMFDYASRV